jgi:hypothetical protein
MHLIVVGAERDLYTKENRNQSVSKKNE